MAGGGQSGAGAKEEHPASPGAERAECPGMRLICQTCSACFCLNAALGVRSFDSPLQPMILGPSLLLTRGRQ